MSIPKAFIGKFVVERSENLEELMKARGVPSVALKIAVTAMSKLTKVIVDNGDGTYKIENQTPLKNTSWTFKLGQPFEAEMWDKKVQITVTVDGDDLKEEHVRDGKEHDLITYKQEGDYMVTVSGASLLRRSPPVLFQTAQAGDIVCRRWFKRQ